MDTQPSEIHLSPTAPARLTPAGRFEVTAITAGEANGWTFPAGALQASLPLWDGIPCFVDHAPERRSVRDLGGAFHNPTWDAHSQGIRLELHTLGPAGPLVDELGRQALAGGAPLGFSADVLFTAQGAAVARIVKVYSLDLVINPARGGAFARALNAVPGAGPFTKGNPMSEATLPTQESNPDLSAMRQLLQVQQEREQLAAEAEAARQVRAQMCAYLLESGLGAARLPAPMAEHIRARFAGRVFEPPELTQAIDEGRKLVSELTGGQVVQGPRLHAMFDSADQLQAAADDLLGAPREPGAEKLSVARLAGIRELYHTLTGDYDLHGGYHPERVRLATTADFTGIIKNALNKIVVEQWALLGKAGYDWWQKIVSVEHFNSIQSITGTLVGTVGSLPAVSEGAAYTELVIGDSPETASFTKYGGYIPLTLELIDRDDTRKLKAYPRELANAGLRRISSLVAAIFTANGGAGPLMADGGALFNAAAVTTAGGHANLLAGALSAAEWETVSTAVYNQPMLVKQASGYYGSGPKMAINPRYLLAPRPLQLTAMKILYPALENSAEIYSENLQRGRPGDVITVPEWSDSNDWAAACDPVVAPAVYVGERFGIRPEIFLAGDELSPAVFTNDEHRLKVRHFLAVWVNDFRPLHKSNVSA